MKLRAAKRSGARNDAKNCQSRRSSKGQEHHLGKLHTPEEARDDEQHHSQHANRVDSHGRGRTSPSHTLDQHRSNIQGRGDERCEVTSPTDDSNLEPEPKMMIEEFEDAYLDSLESIFIYSEHLPGEFFRRVVNSVWPQEVQGCVDSIPKVQVQACADSIPQVPQLVQGCTDSSLLDNLISDARALCANFPETGTEDSNTIPQKMDMFTKTLVVYPGPLGIKVKIDEYGGAVIKSVDPDCTLKGVEVGDRIVEIDGREVTSNADFRVDKDQKRKFKVVKSFLAPRWYQWSQQRKW